MLIPFVNHVDHASLFMIGTVFAFFDPHMLEISCLSQSARSHFLSITLTMPVSLWGLQYLPFVDPRMLKIGCVSQSARSHLMLITSTIPVSLWGRSICLFRSTYVKFRYFITVDVLTLFMFFASFHSFVSMLVGQLTCACFMSVYGDCSFPGNVAQDL